MWFQDPRSLYPGKRRSEPVDSLLDGPNVRPSPTVQQPEIDLWPLPGRSHHLPSSSSFSRNQSFLPIFLPSYVSLLWSKVKVSSCSLWSCAGKTLSTLTSGNDVPVLLWEETQILRILSGLNTKTTTRTTKNRLIRECYSWKTILSLNLSTHKKTTATGSGPGGHIFRSAVVGWVLPGWL